MSRRLSGFTVAKVLSWRCANCGASGMAENYTDLSGQLKAHRAASPSCDESLKPKAITESDAVQEPK